MFKQSNHRLEVFTAGKEESWGKIVKDHSSEGAALRQCSLED